jgi:hypothetical protein
MTPAPRRALVLLLAVAAVLATFAVAFGRHDSGLGSRPAAERPPLLLLTSLPLVFGEDFSLKNTGSLALTRLKTRYSVVPISVTSEAELAKGRLLLMAQPQAQTSENLVALDAWVRGGGRVLLFADPMLEWPSSRPLGDMLRPPPVFADTGLLAHWGLRLHPPAQTGPAPRELRGFRVLTLSPGRLSGGCDIRGDSFIARCRIGKGRATIVADADFFNAGALGSGAHDNLDGLLAELVELQR